MSGAPTPDGTAVSRPTAATPPVDVIVVGAGVAGLASAAALRDAGLAVAVLEARDRFGGRVLTRRDPRSPVPVELGAEFVHGEASLTRGLLERAGAGSVPMEGEPWSARDGRVVRAETWDRIERVMAALPPDADPDRSFAAWLEASGDRFSDEERAAALAFVEGFFAADPDRIGVRALAGEDPETARGDRIPEGYDRVPALLAAGLPGIRRGRVVRRIEWSPGRVRVEGVVRTTRVPFRPLEARALVLTLPLGVLKGPPDALGGVTIEPAVPAWTEAIGTLEAGPVVRLTMRFREPPWGGLIPAPDRTDAPPGFLHTPERSFNAFWPAQPAGSAVLVAWSGGRRAAALPPEPDDLLHRALDDLASATGADREALEEAVAGWWVHDWRRDVFSLGAYAYPAVGGADAAEALSRPVEETLFMAGEHTSADAMGTVEGALASGARAARQVLEAVGRGG